MEVLSDQKGRDLVHQQMDSKAGYDEGRTVEKQHQYLKPRAFIPPFPIKGGYGILGTETHNPILGISSQKYWKMDIGLRSQSQSPLLQLEDPCCVLPLSFPPS